MSELRDHSRSMLTIAAIAMLAMCVRLYFIGINGMITDPDAYGKYAAAYARGHAGPGGEASAFRPPVYPMLLAPFVWSKLTWQFGIPLLHAAFSGLLVVFTFLLAQRIGMKDTGSLAAALLVAVNPQLIFLSSQLMTEPLFAVELVGLLLLWQMGRSRDSGFLTGLGILTRPTMLALWLAVGLHAIATGKMRNWFVATLCAALVCTPWIVRNLRLLGSPVLTTTHGGYTLWLGMNPSFYQTEVLEGRNWAFADEFNEWENANQKQLNERLRDNSGQHVEIERDQVYKQLAVDWIRSHPSNALHSAWYHVKSFWSAAPRSGPEQLRPVVAGYYFGLFLLALVGVWRRRGESSTWLFVAVIVGLTLVHAIFWSNMRMRAPIEPIIAIFAGDAINGMINRRAVGGENAA